MAYIIWNPDITIIDLGFFALRWYSVLFAMGFLLGYFIIKKHFIKENVPVEKLEKLTLYVGLATVIGARLGHCLFYDFDYYSQNILEIFLPFRFHPELHFIGFQGLASHGGGIAIIIALIIYSYKYNLKLLWLLDKLALATPLVGFMIRMGNLMNSEIIGNPAAVPWAFIFQKVDNVPRHPGQLYEAILYLGIFILLYFINKKIHKEPGYIFGLFLILLFSVRFIIEFYKIDQSSFEADMFLNMGQLLSIPFILFGLVLMVLKNKPKNFPDSTSTPLIS
jgi:phosphatidylglycerol---prolipoprotein diacylglyceryl transferase